MNNNIHFRRLSKISRKDNKKGGLNYGLGWRKGIKKKKCLKISPFTTKFHSMVSFRIALIYPMKKFSPKTPTPGYNIMKRERIYMEDLTTNRKLGKHVL